MVTSHVDADLTRRAPLAPAEEERSSGGLRELTFGFVRLLAIVAAIITVACAALTFLLLPDATAPSWNGRGDRPFIDHDEHFASLTMTVLIGVLTGVLFLAAARLRPRPEVMQEPEPYAARSRGVLTAATIIVPGMYLSWMAGAYAGPDRSGDVSIYVLPGQGAITPLVVTLVLGVLTGYLVAQAPAILKQGWYVDTTGGHQYRYWDGTSWAWCADHGRVVPSAPQSHPAEVT